MSSIDDDCATSRLIIKNLPSKITADRLKNICNKLGLVTDCQLKCTQNGLFRKFAFVGFRTPEEAESAKNYLNNTFVDSSRIQVEFCKRLNADESVNNRKKREQNNEQSNSKDVNVSSSSYPQVLLENLPRNVKKKSLLQFFLPLKPLKIEISPDKCSAVIKLKKKSDVKILLKFDGRFFGGNKLTATVMEKNELGNSNIFEQPAAERRTIKQQTEIILETGRLFVRNIPYVCTLTELESTFEKFGPLAEIKLPLDSATKQHKGYAIVSFVMPEHALKAFTEMDGVVYHGRMLHIVPGEENKDGNEKSNRTTEETSKATSSYKTKKADQQKATAASSHNWNTLFLGANAVADVLVDKYSAEKSQLLDPTSKTSLGIRMALGETQIVRETREFLLQNNVCLDSFSGKSRIKRSTTVIIVKNLPARTDANEIRELFSKYGSLGRVVLPTSGISCLVEFLDEQQAKKAFKQLAYKRFKTTPLFLEWAPGDVFVAGATKSDQHSTSAESFETATSVVESSEVKKQESISTDDPNEGDGDNNDDTDNTAATIFVKNLNFETTDESLREHFSKIGPLVYATVSKKKAVGRQSKDDGQFLSMGYGFVQYKRKADALRALKELQKQKLDEFALELKLSERQSASDALSATSKHRKETKTDGKNESDTKLLVRNIPFQASRSEIEEIFKTFGVLRNVRLPKKAGNSSGHRGFGFVDFTNRSDAMKAFEALSHSTHLYGRRLVLSWAAEEESLDDLRKRIADFGSGKTAKKQKLMLEDLDKNY